MVDRRDVRVGELRLACYVSGREDASPLVLLHALGEAAYDFDAIVTDLGQHRRLYALDLRGHGSSDWPGAYSSS